MASVLLDTKTVAVGTIYCIGKNYEAHAKEMRNKLGLEFSDTAATQEPIVFSKPASSLIHSGESITIPRFRGKAISNEMHHELELVVLIGRRAVEVSEENAADYVAGFGVGLDMTLRDRQTEAKRNGQPWLLRKGSELQQSYPISSPCHCIRLAKWQSNSKKTGSACNLAIRVR